MIDVLDKAGSCGYYIGVPPPNTAAIRVELHNGDFQELKVAKGKKAHLFAATINPKLWVHPAFFLKGNYNV